MVEDMIISHDQKKHHCESVKNLNDVSDTLFNACNIVVIEEAQFFTDLIEFINKCLKNNKIIYVAGLDGDSNMKPFGDILKLIPMCDSLKRLSALCLECKDGTEAHFTKRIVKNDNQTLIGSSDLYIPM